MIDAEKMVGATAYRFDSPYMKFFHDNFPTQMMECMYRNSAMCSVQEVGGNTCTVAVRILDALPDEWVYATLGLANFVHLVEAADGIPKQDWGGDCLPHTKNGGTKGIEDEGISKLAHANAH